MKIFNLLTTLAILALSSFSTFATPVYVIRQGGDMLFYKHAGFNDGSGSWPIEAKKIGIGWHIFRQVFAGDNGAVYAIRQNGDMLFYKHAGYNDASTSWPIHGRNIGTGWHIFRQVFAGANGAVYAIAQNGDMFFYKHAGINDGSANWPIHRIKIGTGWHIFRQVFAGANGAVYAIAQNGDMFFYKHAGINDGSANWPIHRIKIGNGWIFENVFAVRDATVIPVTIQQLQIRRFTTSFLSNAEADRILRDATILLQTNDGAGDVDCNIVLARSGNVGVFANGDGSIDSQAEFAAVIALPGYVKVVNAINFCGAFNPHIIGCAPVPGNSLTVVRHDNAEEGILWAHEYGHTKGLNHRDADANAVMNGVIGPERRRITAAECIAFRR